MRHEESLREWVNASLWVLPFASGLLAIGGFAALSHAPTPPGTPLALLAFAGTGTQARDLLITITGTVVTVIALVMGLSVVALTTASTQYSPRLLRNFLRDRTTQGVLSVFLATFSYCAAGLYTVGIGPGSEENVPRLAVSLSIVLLFLSLGAVVVFSNHLSHSIQVDAIMRRVERESLRVARLLPAEVDDDVPTAPAWSVPIQAWSSGYVVTAHPEKLALVALEHGVSIKLTRRVGEHIVAGRTLADVWTASPDDEPPDTRAIGRELDEAVGIGFERTQQQDVAMGIRQLVDAACKALSPAINDPYTAVQAIDHLSVIFAELARHPLGPVVARHQGTVVVVPSRRFEDYLGTMCGLVRRYGASEPTVALALLRLLADCAVAARNDWDRLLAIADQAWLITSDAKRKIPQAADFKPIKVANRALIERIERYRHDLPGAATRTAR